MRFVLVLQIHVICTHRLQIRECIVLLGCIDGGMNIVYYMIQTTRIHTYKKNKIQIHGRLSNILVDKE